MVKIFTKDQLIEQLLEIAQKGWIPNTRHKNHGGIGNTLEDLIGIEENNLPIPNASEWELKTKRAKTSSLTALFHCEPSPRAIGFVPNIFLVKYGWRHEKAGKKYSENERSFRQTIHGLNTSNRGFRVVIDRKEKKVLVSFDYKKIDERHAEWLGMVKKNVGLSELDPQPYWGFDDLAHLAGTKMPNMFYVQADVKKEKRKEFYKYSKIVMLQRFNFENFLTAIEVGDILLDFDALTGHNHGTKFRVRRDKFFNLYETAKTIL